MKFKFNHRTLHLNNGKEPDAELNIITIIFEEEFMHAKNQLKTVENDSNFA